MVTKQKINRAKVMAALNTLCPKCGYSIPPGEIRRVDFDKMECPGCGARFKPGALPPPNTVIVP
jgi:ribosomal protein S27AE